MKWIKIYNQLAHSEFLFWVRRRKSGKVGVYDRRENLKRAIIRPVQLGNLISQKLWAIQMVEVCVYEMYVQCASAAHSPEYTRTISWFPLDVPTICSREAPRTAQLVYFLVCNFAMKCIKIEIRFHAVRRNSFGREKETRIKRGGTKKKGKKIITIRFCSFCFDVFGIIQFSLNHLRIAHYTYAEYTAEFDRKTLVWFNFVALCFCCISRWRHFDC